MQDSNLVTALPPMFTQQEVVIKVLSDMDARPCVFSVDSDHFVPFYDVNMVFAGP